MSEPMVTPDAIWWTGNTSNQNAVGVPVRVLRTRRSYGGLQAQIQPLGGQGLVWVALHKLDQWSDDPLWVAVTLDTRQRCDSCGWTIPGAHTHYKARDGDTHHCTACHPIGTTWDVSNDSEPLADTPPDP